MTFFNASSDKIVCLEIREIKIVLNRIINGIIYITCIIYEKVLI